MFWEQRNPSRHEGALCLLWDRTEQPRKHTTSVINFLREERRAARQNMGQEWSRLRKKGSQCVIAPHGAFSKGRKTCRNIFLLKVILKEGREAEQNICRYCVQCRDRKEAKKPSGTFADSLGALRQEKIRPCTVCVNFGGENKSPRHKSPWQHFWERTKLPSRPDIEDCYFWT